AMVMIGGVAASIAGAEGILLVLPAKGDKDGAEIDASACLQTGVASPPSTMMVSTSPAPLRRKAAASSYSREVKQATPCSKLGNSITTKRWNLSGPSMIWKR